MEEVTKDNGHRASVSMPSLDATDDFPTQTASTEVSESVSTTTSSTFVSTSSSELIVSSSGHTDAFSTDTVSFSSTDSVSAGVEQPVESQTLIDESSSDHLIDDNNTPLGTTSTEPIIDESPKEGLIEETSTTEPSVEEASSEPLIEESSAGSLINTEACTEQLLAEVTAPQIIETDTQESNTQSLIDVASDDPLPLLGTEILPTGEVLDDSQGEEDPSIAIDQFIKKIADEQLSSKRIEERKEEEAKEQNQEVESGNLDIGEGIVEQNSGNKSQSGEEVTETAGNSLAQEQLSESVEPSSLENTLTEEKTKEKLTEPMEVDGDIHNAPTQRFDILGSEMTENNLNEVIESEDHLQMESIEEIQKEIDRIPTKNTLNKVENKKNQESNSQNGLERNANQNENHTQESIEQILGEDIRAPEKSVNNILNKELTLPTAQDATVVAKDSLLIEKAQEEILKLDVLVCGECHNTFYFAQEFIDHKNGKCTKTSVLTGICENENKPQVWGFILWKIKQTKDFGDNILSSWTIYQRWCKLPQLDKNAWITAGQMIQFANRIGNAKVTEVKPPRQAKQVIVHKVMDKEQAPPPIEFVDSNKENSSIMEMDNTASNILKKGINKPVKLNNDVTILPSTKNASTNREQTNTNKAIRTTKVLSTQKEEYVVEKIMAKRFNPRRKTWEYNIKWENFTHESNTWEPISNLSHCKNMLDQFEEQLKRMKEEKAKQAAQSPKGRGRPSNPKPIKPNTTNFIPIAPKTDLTPKISNVVGGVGDDYAGSPSSSTSRPTRSSKQKALNQVKQWCGNISDDDSGGALKRKHETDDSDEDYDDKKIKLEDDSDFSDKEIKPKISVKKVTSSASKQTVKNGSTGAQQVLPSNILIPDANGVVRINQKQLPSLSSGVYIMSKTAGIIKLDSTTSKVATSGGQTIVKVAPKIGQTQIKIVKKDGNTTKQIIQVSPKPVTSTPIKVNASKANTPRFTPKIRKEVRKPPPLTETVTKLVTTKKPEPPPSVPSSNQEEESDDGLEPLPFPGPDEPIPELDENQDDEFVLDPSTGKIAGVEYEDKPVVIKEEPQPAPPSTNDLENIVKLAAAEITESDSHDNDSQMELDPLFTETKVVRSSNHPNVISSTGTQVVRKVVKYTTAQGMKTESSILNKALTQGSNTSAAIISPVKSSNPVQVQQRPRVVQQRVINQMVSRTPSSSGQTRTVVRHVIGPGRSSTGGNLNVIRKTVAPAPKPRFNLAPQKPLPSPLQPTRTYSAMGGIRQHNTGPGSKVQVYSTKSVAGNQGGQTPGVRRIGNTIVRTSSSGQSHTVQKQQSSQYATQKPVTRIVQRVVTSPKKSETQNVINRSVSQPQHRVVASSKPKNIISMPSLTDEDGPVATTPKIVQKTQQAQKPVPQLAAKPAIKQELPIPLDESASSESPTQSESADNETNGEQPTDWSSFTMADGENPIYVTGDDGTIYQVAGQNEQGQTILITQGPDGQQQCLLVTNEIGEMAPDPEPSTSTADVTAKETAVAAEEPAQEAESEATAIATSAADSIHTPLQIQTDTTEMEGIEEGMQDQVVAQVVRAEPPSPGGTHKVVVMLPDGNLMVTQVSPEEYASLELE